jgi:hypothetical protein
MSDERPMSLRFPIAILFSLVYLAGAQDGTVVVSLANDQQTPNRPGLTPYTPTKIEWLALAVNSQLRQDASADSPFSLAVVQSDHETLLIFVPYDPTVNREIMNSTIDTARKVIMSTAKSYGWEKWVKIRERVEMFPPKK